MNGSLFHPAFFGVSGLSQLIVQRFGYIGLAAMWQALVRMKEWLQRRSY